MSKHLLPATELDDTRTVWLHPDTADLGWRLRLDVMKDDNAFLYEEQVLPECVDNPQARRILCNKASMVLTRDDIRWLRDALTELLQDTE